MRNKSGDDDDDDDTEDDDDSSISTIHLEPDDKVVAPLKPAVILKEPKVWQRFSRTGAIGVGTVQIVVGIGNISLALTGLARNAEESYVDENYTFNIATGIWGGACVITAGGLLIGAGIKKTTWLMVSSLILSMFSICCGLAGIILASVGISEENVGSNYDEGAVVICAMLLLFAFAELSLSLYVTTMIFMTLCGQDAHKPDRYDHYSGTLSVVFGATMIICGSTCTLCHITMFMWEFWVGGTPSPFLYSSFGIWGSVFLVGGGAVAIRAKNDPTTWIITSSTTLSTIATLCSTIMTTLASFLVGDDYDSLIVIIGSVMIALSIIGFVASTVVASLGSVLCCRKINRVKPKLKIIQVRKKKTKDAPSTVQAQMMYLDVQGLPPTAGAQGSAVHMQPVPGISSGQMLYMRETNDDGLATNMKPYIIQKPIILGYQHAVVQQTLIPMQQIDQDAMYGGEGAVPPIVVGAGQVDAGLPRTENDRGRHAPHRAAHRGGPPAPPKLPTLNPPAPPRGRHGQKVNMSSFVVSSVNEENPFSV